MDRRESKGELIVNETFESLFECWGGWNIRKEGSEFMVVRRGRIDQDQFDAMDIMVIPSTTPPKRR